MKQKYQNFPLINKKIIDLYTLMEKEDSILKNLMEKKKLLNKIIINKLLKGKNDYQIRY